jgi:hypothetical protein
MECFFNRRGIEQEQTAGSAGKWEFDGGYRQGGITPLFAEGNNNGNAAGTIIFNNMVQDTEAVGSVAIWGVNGTNGISIQSNFLSNSSADINGVPPPFSGQRAAAVTEFGSYMGNAPNRGSEVTSNPTCVVTYPYAITGTNSCISDAMHKFFETVDFPSRNSIFWDLPVPTAVTVDNATAGGSLTANTTYYYTVSATGVDGGETVPATVAASSNTTSLNRTFDVSWTGITGAESYNVYRCSLHCVFTDGRIQNSGNWRLIKRLVLTTKIIDNGLGVGQGPPTVTGTGTVGVNATEVYAPAFVTVSPLSNGKSYIATDTAPVTADRSYTKPDQSGTYALDLTGMISVINGKVLDSSCISGTARVEKAMVGMPVIVSTADGSDLGGRFNVRGSVSKNNIVTVYICGTGTPPSKAYNVRVIQ